MQENISLQTVVAGKLVLVALPSTPDWVKILKDNQAKDVLLLDRRSSPAPVRHRDHVARRLNGLISIANSNCQVAILDSWSCIALSRKRYFWKSRLETILAPAGTMSLLYRAGLKYYSRSRRLAVAGEVKVDLGNGSRRYLVISVNRTRSTHNRRVFAPYDWSAKQIFDRMNGLDHVLLRSVEAIESGDDFKDIDILVSDAGLLELRERFNHEVGLFPFEVYAESGIDGHDFQSVPYFFPEMARKILGSGQIRGSGIRAASPKWQYLSLAYHLIFHGKSRHLAPDAALDETTFSKPLHYQSLLRLASEAGFPQPRSFDDLDTALKENDAFPGRDLIGFYARRNKFVAGRYLYRHRVKPGLVVFYVRDFGHGSKPVPEVANVLRNEYEVVAEGPVTPENREVILEKIRGGNWFDNPQNGYGEPVHWFACWDSQPKAPVGKLRRKYPHLDNAKIAVTKQHLRQSACGNGSRIVHTSDNSDEALEHLRAIGVIGHPDVARTIAQLGG